MRFMVARPFRLPSGTVMLPGSFVELDLATAARYRRAGVVAGPERAVASPVEKAVKKRGRPATKEPSERRTRKEIIPASEIKEPQEIAQDGAETDNAAGD